MDTNTGDAVAMAAIVSQPVSAGMKAFLRQNERAWNSGLCGCCSECKAAVLMFLCPCWFQCILARRMRESGCVPFCVPAGLLTMRVRLRSKLDIEGTICKDCFAVMLCGPFAACQMSRELDHVGIPKFPIGQMT